MALGYRGFLSRPGAVLWWLACGCTAFTLYGFHQEDEIGQITAFYLFKAGIVPADHMPWEFHTQARPWFQPAVYYSLLQPLLPEDYHFLLAERLTLLVQFLLLSVALPLALATLLPRSPGVSQSRFATWWLASVAAWWFVPSMLVRHSSEAFAALFLVFFLIVWTRLEAAKRQAGWIALGAGFLASLCFGSRYQMGIFLAGFCATWFVATGRPGSSKRRVFTAFLLGGLAGLGVLLAIDAWGYGSWQPTPWNYLREQLLEDRASSFGVSPWYFYLLNVPLYTLNPLIWIFLYQASRSGWKDPFDRSLAVGMSAFLLVHSLIPHKEMRFLMPLVPPAFVLLARMQRRLEASQEPAPWRPALPFFQAVAGLHVTALVFVMVASPVSGRNRLDLALWDLPAGTTVFSATDLYHAVDGSWDEEPPFAPSGFVSLFRKPPGIRYVYAAPDRFRAACGARPEAVLLLSSAQPRAAAEASVDSQYPAIARYPPEWISSLPWLQRSWRYQLVACRDYLPAR